jgi:hypothetical protein
MRMLGMVALAHLIAQIQMKSISTGSDGGLLAI